MREQTAMSDLSLQNKVALITGAGQGVGQGIALAMAQHGAIIAATGRTLEKVEHTCELVKERGGKCLALHCNVKDAKSLDNTVDAVIAEFGRLDILVNNAQEMCLGSLLEMSDETF